MIPLPTVHATQGGIPFCTAFASAAAGFYFLGQDASLHWAVCADPRLDEIDGSTIDRTVAALIAHGAVPWSACPGYGNRATAQAAVNPVRAQLAALAKGPTSTEQLYYNQDTLDIDAVIRTLDMGYPILATADLQDLYELDVSGSTRFTVPNERKGGSHAVCIVPEYQRRPDGIYVRYVNSFGSAWGDRGTGWALLCTGWYQMWAVVGDLYKFEKDGVSDLSEYAGVLLKQGNRGEAVKALQKALMERGYTIAVDGVFGAGTLAIVREYQRAVGLTADGIVGAKTWTALMGNAGSSAPTPVDLSKWTWTAAEKNVRLSPNWTVGDLWLNSKMTELTIDPLLVKTLDAFTARFGQKPRFVTENSIYCKSGHSSGSMHYKGMAADFYIPGVTPLELAQFAETLEGVHGIGVYAGWDEPGRHIHIDTRPGKRICWWVKTTGSNTPGFGGVPVTYKSGHRSPAILLLQRDLNSLGFQCGTPDGVYGAKTVTAVKAMQKLAGLTADGVYGTNSRAAMETLLREAGK